MNCFDETTCDVILNLVTQIWGKYIAVVSCGLWFALEEADEEIKAEISPCGWQVWFPERQVEILNRNKECTLRGKEGRPWRQNKSMNGAAPKGSGEEPHFIIHPSRYPAVFHLSSFIVGSEHRRISLPVSSHCFLSRIETVIPTSIVISAVNKDLHGGVGGIRDTRVKGNWHSTFPRPLTPAQQKQQRQIKEGHSPRLGNAGHTVSVVREELRMAERSVQPREAAASRCKKQFYKNSPLLKYGEGKPST